VDCGRRRSPRIAGEAMPAWLIPALKAALPHIAAIISAAAPVFTRKADAANQAVIAAAADYGAPVRGVPERGAHPRSCGAVAEHGGGAGTSASIAEGSSGVLFVCVSR